MRLGELVDASAAVTATPARNAKVGVLAALLARAGPDEVAPVVSWLSGELTQRQIGVGWAMLRERPAPAAEATLSVAELERALGEIGALRGPGSVAARRAAVQALLARASAAEQEFLMRLLLGDLAPGCARRRHDRRRSTRGRAAGERVAAGADAARRPRRRDGDRAARRRAGLAAIRLRIGRPLAPMLAGTAPDVTAALDRTGPAAIDYKLDGARLQVHRDGDDVALFTRTLDDVTARLPEVVATARALPVRAIVLDGEAIALRSDGRPEPFQVTAARFGTRGARATPLASLFFDVLHVDGEDLLDEPLARRGEALGSVVAPELRVPRAVAEDADAAARCSSRARGRARGRRRQGARRPYAAGRRGSGWLKVKPVHTLDLVVLAAEWGHGRRRGRLSNLHLGARDEDGRLGDARQDVQGPDRRAARVADGAAARARDAARGHRGARAARARRRDRSTASRPRRAIRPGWRCASRA